MIIMMLDTVFKLLLRFRNNEATAVNTEKYSVNFCLKCTLF